MIYLFGSSKVDRGLRFQSITTRWYCCSSRHRHTIAFGHLTAARESKGASGHVFGLSEWHYSSPLHCCLHCWKVNELTHYCKWFRCRLGIRCNEHIRLSRMSWSQCEKWGALKWLPQKLLGGSQRLGCRAGLSAFAQLLPSMPLKSADSKEADSYIHYIDSNVLLQTIHASRQLLRHVLTKLQATTVMCWPLQWCSYSHSH